MRNFIGFGIHGIPTERQLFIKYLPKTVVNRNTISTVWRAYGSGSNINVNK